MKTWKASRQEKTMFLVRHPELLGADDLKIFKALVAAGMASKTTSKVDLAISKLREAAIEILVEMKVKEVING